MSPEHIIIATLLFLWAQAEYGAFVWRRAAHRCRDSPETLAPPSIPCAD